MARVYIDPHMFSEAWFQGVLGDLVKCTKVIFSYGESKKMSGEISKVRQALAFYKMVGQLRTTSNQPRRHDADKKDLEDHQNILEGMKCYKDCTHCDDAHIFSLVYLKPTPYIFSKDQRMAKCRGELNKHVDKRYCNFIVISTDEIFKVHKNAVLS
jgi:hypothetical protein